MELKLTLSLHQYIFQLLIGGSMTLDFVEIYQLQLRSEEESSEARIIDIRREAAGVQSFKKFKVGDEIEIQFHGELKGQNL